MLSAYYGRGENAKKIFDSLEILKDKEFTDEYLGQFPVIYLSLKSVDGLDFKDAYGKLAELVAGLGEQFSFLKESEKISKEQKERTSSLKKTYKGVTKEERIVKNYVAEIEGKDKYETIADAFAAANDGDAKAKLTLKKLTYDITKQIGAYAAAMNGVDLIVFTGGIGENNTRLRRRVCENLTYMGVKFDYDANVVRGVDTIITLPDSKVKVALITTNEELMIARDTMNIVQNED